MPDDGCELVPVTVPSAQAAIEALLTFTETLEQRYPLNNQSPRRLVESAPFVRF
jgi:hypothetical protein